MSDVVPSAPTFSLRPAATADEPFLRSLFASTVPLELRDGALPPAARDPLIATMWKGQRATFGAAHPGAVEQIIVAGGAPVGRLWCDAGAGVLLILDVSLLPDVRGRGLGAAVLAGVLAAAAAAGQEVALRVLRGSRARGLYGRLGFVEEAGDDPVRVAMRWSAPD